jgi:hypothetical protein
VKESQYIKGLKILDEKMKQHTPPIPPVAQTYGGTINRNDTGNHLLDSKIKALDNTMLYKITSFGKEFIGYGLSDEIIHDFALFINISILLPNEIFETKFKEYCENCGLSLSDT